MAYYLFQVAAPPETWATLVRNPHNRAEAVRPVIERLGGKLHEYLFYLPDGEYDSLLLVEYPDNRAAAALAAGVMASGVVKTVKMTPMFTQDEAMENWRKADQAGYRPPRN